MTTAMFGENDILAGGTDQCMIIVGDTKKTVISNNIKTQKSTRISPMKTARSGCRAVVMETLSLVVMGEKAGERKIILKTQWKYLTKKPLHAIISL